MEEHVTSHAQSGEEQMADPMNTPVDSASHPTGKYHCNEIENNEKCISIITFQLYLYNCLGFLQMMPQSIHLHALLINAPKVWCGGAYPQNQ